MALAVLAGGDTRTASDGRPATIGRLLRVSGWLELTLATGHNVVGTLLITRPDDVAPIVAALRWPAALLAPIATPEQRALVLGMSLAAGTAWMVFGAILVWQGRTRAARPDVPLLGLVLLHQLTFAVIMVRYVWWHPVGIAMVLAMVIALGRALALARGRR